MKMMNKTCILFSILLLLPTRVTASESAPIELTYWQAAGGLCLLSGVVSSALAYAGIRRQESRLGEDRFSHDLISRGKKNDVEAVKKILARMDTQQLNNALIRSKIRYNFAPEYPLLQWYCRYGHTESDSNIFEYLVKERECDIHMRITPTYNVGASQPKRTSTLVHELCRDTHSNGHRALQILIDRKADLNSKNEDGNTPLHLSTIWGISPTTRMLIEGGADVNILNNKGQPPIHIAARNHGQNTLQIAALLRIAGALPFDKPDIAYQSEEMKRLCAASYEQLPQLLVPSNPSEYTMDEYAEILHTRMHHLSDVDEQQQCLTHLRILQAHAKLPLTQCRDLQSLRNVSTLIDGHMPHDLTDLTLEYALPVPCGPLIQHTTSEQLESKGKNEDIS